MTTIENAYNKQLATTATTVQLAALGNLEDLGFLTQLASRSSRFQHPVVREFLEEDNTDKSGETAAIAYRSVLEELGTRLTDAERKQIGPSCTLRDVLAVVNEARIIYYKSSKKRDKVEKMARVLNCYSKSIDAACQHHPEFTSLIWGSMRFILQVSLNYFDILSGLATMLTAIGDNLGRFDMYLQIYPTARMKAVCSKLYAAITGFLKDAIVFFKKSRLRKYFSAFWSPFEVKYKDSIEEIQRLERLVERDAIALGLMQLQLDNTALAERSLVLSHQIRFIIDFKNNEARILLSDLRAELFFGHEADTTYHEDLVNLYRTTSTPDWEYWFAEERKHVDWSHQPRSTLTYMQTDLVEPQIYCKWVALGRSLAGKVPFAHIVWAPSMTAYSALASILIQTLQQRPDLLHRESRHFYLQKFRRSKSFDGLWTVFQEVLSSLPGFLCYITIPSVGDQEEAFAKRIIDLFEVKHGCPVNLQLVTPVHPAFPKPKAFIDIDAMYDVSPHMDSSDALLHVLLAELGYPSRVGKDIQATMWQSLWRTVCYSVNAIALEQLRLAIAAVVDEVDGIGSKFLDWMWTREGEQHLHAYLRPCLETLVFALPADIRDRLDKTLQNAIRKHVRVDEGRSSEAIPHYELPNDMKVRQSKPNEMQCRERTWQGMKRILGRAPVNLFTKFSQSQLPSVLRWLSAEVFQRAGISSDEDVSRGSVSELLQSKDWVAVSDKIFSSEEWDSISMEVGDRFFQEIVVAIEKGLARTVHITLGAETCNCLI